MWGHGDRLGKQSDQEQEHQFGPVRDGTGSVRGTHELIVHGLDEGTHIRARPPWADTSTQVPSTRSSRYP